MERALALFLVVAWRIARLMRLGRTEPQLDASLLFEHDEWIAVYVLNKKKPPARPPTLNEMVRLVANACAAASSAAKVTASPAPRRSGRAFRRSCSAPKVSASPAKIMSGELCVTRWLEGADPCTALGLVPGQSSVLHGWIVDTSIEADHQRFGGFLKLSFEELLIALRDDRHLLNDPGVILAGSSVAKVGTLYPHGFTAERLLEVIEGEEVWAGA